MVIDLRPHKKPRWKCNKMEFIIIEPIFIRNTQVVVLRLYWIYATCLLTINNLLLHIIKIIGCFLPCVNKWISAINKFEVLSTFDIFHITIKLMLFIVAIYLISKVALHIQSILCSALCSSDVVYYNHLITLIHKCTSLALLITKNVYKGYTARNYIFYEQSLSYYLNYSGVF